MAVTVSAYNHTTKLFAEGSINSTDSIKVILCTAATFDATQTLLASISKTETTGSGYTAGGAALQNIVVSTVTTNDAKFDADDVVWTSGSSNTLTASYAIVYNDTLTGDPPLLFIDFGGAESAGPSTDFKIIWNTSGIFSFSI